MEPHPADSASGCLSGGYGTLFSITGHAVTGKTSPGRNLKMSPSTTNEAGSRLHSPFRRTETKLEFGGSRCEFGAVSGLKLLVMSPASHLLRYSEMILFTFSDALWRSSWFIRWTSITFTTYTVRVVMIVTKLGQLITLSASVVLSVPHKQWSHTQRLLGVPTVRLPTMRRLRSR